MSRLRVPGTLCSTFLVLTALLLMSSAGQVWAETEEVPTFQRGDVSVNGRVDMFDVFELLDYVFLEQPQAVACDDAYDVTDDGALGVGDAVSLLTYLFLNGPPPAAPFDKCDVDPTDDDKYGCELVPGCDPKTITRPPTEEELAEYAQVGHVLRRMAYGQTPDLFDRIREMDDIEEWIDEQLDPDSIEENEELEDLLGLLSPEDDLEDLYREQVLRAVYSEKQLVEVLTDFWENHFNTHFWKVRDYFANLRVGNTRVYNDDEALELAVIHEAAENARIRENVFGDFESMLKGSGTGVPMLIYLDNIVNIAANPNENYGREIMELHTVGVDNGYTQADIEEVARIFTGWTICLKEPEDADDPLSACVELTINPDEDLVWAFHFDVDEHDFSEKVIFDDELPEAAWYTVDENEGGTALEGLEEGLGFMEHLAQMSQTAEYVSTKLMERFVADYAPGGLLADMIVEWDSTDGDMGAVIEELLKSEEFLDDEYYRNNKVRTAFEYLVATARAFEGEVPVNADDILESLEDHGQMPFNFGTPDGFPEGGGDQLGTARLLMRMRFANGIFEDDDDIDYPRIVRIMRDRDVDVSDPEEVATFWLNRMFAGIYNDIDLDIAIQFLETNDAGDEQDLQPWANLFTIRIGKFLAFLSSYPQHLKQ